MRQTSQTHFVSILKDGISDCRLIRTITSGWQTINRKLSQYYQHHKGWISYLSSGLLPQSNILLNLLAQHRLFSLTHQVFMHQSTCMTLPLNLQPKACECFFCIFYILQDIFYELLYKVCARLHGHSSTPISLTAQLLCSDKIQDRSMGINY